LTIQPTSALQARGGGVSVTSIKTEILHALRFPLADRRADSGAAPDLVPVPLTEPALPPARYYK
jgi:hypothetical protein